MLLKKKPPVKQPVKQPTVSDVTPPVVAPPVVVTPQTPPVPVNQVVVGNNGTVSCNRFCGGINGAPWNNEIHNK